MANAMYKTFLTAAAGMMAMASDPSLYMPEDGPIPFHVRRKAEKTKSESKKCKSCALACKGKQKYDSWTCPHRRYVDPMGMACEYHTKKKKK